MISFLSIIAIGFFLGMRHATDPDHVIAVTTIVSRQNKISRAALTGIFWGVGHTLTIFVVGTAIILFGVVIPARLGLSMELSVALMLVLLGLMNIVAFMRSAGSIAKVGAHGSSVHSHHHSHGDFIHAHPHGHRRRRIRTLPIKLPWRAWTRSSAGSESIVSSGLFGRHSSRVGRFGGGGSAGAEYHPRSEVGHCLFAGVRRRYCWRNDADYHEHRFCIQFLRTTTCELCFPIGLGFRAPQPGVRAGAGLSDWIRQRTFQWSSAMDAALDLHFNANSHFFLIRM